MMKNKTVKKFLNDSKEIGYTFFCHSSYKFLKKVNKLGEKINE